MDEPAALPFKIHTSPSGEGEIWIRVHVEPSLMEAQRWVAGEFLVEWEGNLCGTASEPG